jgi:hypothetical protein
MFGPGRIKADPPPFVLLDELKNFLKPGLCLGLGEWFDLLGCLPVFIGEFGHTCKISKQDDRLSGQLPNSRFIFRPHCLSEFASRLLEGLLRYLILFGLLGVQKLKAKHNESATEEKQKMTVH